MARKLDLSKTVYELIQEYPELKDIMIEIGFKDLANPKVLKTVGRVMTIPKGCAVKGIDVPMVLSKLGENGFELAGSMPKSAFGKKMMKKALGDKVFEEDQNESGLTVAEARRHSLIKSYISRLSEGEDLESVREDFVKEFKDVDALEIVKAEQAMIDEGVPLAKVQSLCDIHSALFHGATREEQIENAEKTVIEARVKANAQDQQVKGETKASEAQALLDQKSKEARAKKDEAKSKMARMIEIPGHPLYVFAQENLGIEAQIEESREALAAAVATADDSPEREEKDQLLLRQMKTMRRLSVHYAKKGDLLYPVLASRYGVPGPSAVMWGVDDEIRDEIRLLASFAGKGDWYDSIEAVLKRAEEMLFKERNILFPLCAENFTEEEWKGIARDLQDYDPCFTEEIPIWDQARDLKRPEASIEGDEVRFPVGHMNAKQLSAMLDTIPLEITFIDKDDINRYFNRTHGKKLFKRPDAAIDREVYFCHPAKIEPMVRGIIDDFRAGRRDSVDVWMNKNDKPVLVRYMAVYSDDNEFQGTMEIVQNMEFAEKHFV